MRGVGTTSDVFGVTHVHVYTFLLINTYRYPHSEISISPRKQSTCAPFATPSHNRSFCHHDKLCAKQAGPAEARPSTTTTTTTTAKRARVRWRTNWAELGWDGLGWAACTVRTGWTALEEPDGPDRQRAPAGGATPELGSRPLEAVRSPARLTVPLCLF